jgi:hypothetical protein
VQRKEAGKNQQTKIPSAHATTDPTVEAILPKKP